MELVAQRLLTGGVHVDDAYLPMAWWWSSSFATLVCNEMDHVLHASSQFLFIFKSPIFKRGKASAALFTTSSFLTLGFVEGLLFFFGDDERFFCLS